MPAAPEASNQDEWTRWGKAGVGFGAGVLVALLGFVARSAGWDAPYMDKETLPPLLFALATVGFLVGCWFALDALGWGGEPPPS